MLRRCNQLLKHQLNSKKALLADYYCEELVELLVDALTNTAAADEE